MSDQAIATATQAQPAAQNAPIDEKPRRIPKAIVHAIRLLVTGECKTIKAAAERANITREWLSRNLARDHVRVFMERESRQTIALGMMRASARLNELVDAGSEHVSFEASKHVLAIAGIKPVQDAQVSVNIDIKAGYVIDLSEPDHKTIDGTAIEVLAERKE